MRDFHADFLSEDLGLPERNRKAHARIQQDVVIGILRKSRRKILASSRSLPKKCLGHTAFVKIPATRPHWQPQHRWADGIQ